MWLNGIHASSHGCPSVECTERHPSASCWQRTCYRLPPASQLTAMTGIRLGIHHLTVTHSLTRRVGSVVIRSFHHCWQVYKHTAQRHLQQEQFTTATLNIEDKLKENKTQWWVIGERLFLAQERGRFPMREVHCQMRVLPAGELRPAMKNADTMLDTDSMSKKSSDKNK